MKTFVAVCVLAVIAYTQAQTLTAEQTQKLKEHVKICSESTHITDEQIQKLRNNDFSDEDVQCAFVDCMFTRIGFLNDKKELQIDVIKAKAPAGVSKDDLETVITTCSKVQASADKYACALYKCYLSETPVKIQLLQV